MILWSKCNVSKEDVVTGNKIIVKCDRCSMEKEVCYRRNRYEEYLCHSCKIKKLWEDKEYQDKQKKLKAKRNVWDDERRDKISKVAKANWSNESYVEKQKRTRNTLSFKKAQSKRSKAVWSDKTKRDDLSKKIKKIKNSKSEKIAQSHRSKKQWEDPDYIEKFNEGMSKVDWSLHIKKLWQNPKVREKLIEHVRKLNVTNMRTMPMSKPHQTVYDYLVKKGFDVEPNFIIGPYQFDILIKDKSILIEINGEYWHSLPEKESRDRSKYTYITKYFPQFRMLTLWENEINNEFSNIIKSLNVVLGGGFDVKEFCFNDVKISYGEFKDVRNFLSKYHYQGCGKGGNTIIAKLDDKIIAAFVLSSITRNESAKRLNCSPSSIRELTRFCIHPQYHKKNFASWFMSKSIKTLDTSKLDYLISFADSTVGHDGTIYKASNWKEDGKVRPSYYYVNSDGQVHKKTIWDRAKKENITESEYAKKNGYKKMKTKPKIRFLYKL